MMVILVKLKNDIIQFFLKLILLLVLCACAHINITYIFLKDHHFLLFNFYTIFI